VLVARKPKGITARLRARKARKDRLVADRIRELVSARDGYCRYGKDVHPSGRDACEGVSEWAHFDGFKRFKTRGRAPEDRHTMAGSLMLCTRHHAQYDQGKLGIIAWDGVALCNGPLLYR
jgi:hypothetical protein